MSDPSVIIRGNPLDLAPRERLRRVREILAKESPDEWRRQIPRFIDPNAPVRLGAITVGDRTGAAQMSWRESATKPGTRKELRSHRVQAPADLWDDMKQIRRRDPLERVESMVRRYVAEWKAGNTAVLENLGREICGQYWLAGAPISEDKLRQLAAASLQRAENRQRANFFKKTASPWAVK